MAKTKFDAYEKNHVVIEKEHSKMREELSELKMKYEQKDQEFRIASDQLKALTNNSLRDSEIITTKQNQTRVLEQENKILKELYEEQKE